jgi:hypothetical protein
MTDQSEGKPPDFNPYKAPQTDVTPPNSASNPKSPFSKESPDEIRERYLTREATVKAIGIVTMLLGIFLIANLGIILVLDALLPTPIERVPVIREPDSSMFGLSLVLISMWAATLWITLGLQLRALKKWARYGVMIFLVVGMLDQARMMLDFEFLNLDVWAYISVVAYLFANGINLYLFFSLMRSDSKFVCSPFYHSMIARTPQLHPTFGILDWILLVAFVTVNLVGLVSRFYE